MSAEKQDKPAKSGMRARDIAVGRADILRVRPSDIHVKPGWNVRDENEEYDAHIDTLAQSIAEVGVKEALRCYLEDGKLVLSSGHSRMRAVARAKERFGAEIETVPVIMEDRHASEGDRVLMLLVTNSGKPLTPLEQSRVFLRLANMGWSPQQIAQKSGVTLTTVNRGLELNAMPEEIKEMVAEGSVSATLAIDTVKNSRTKSDAVSNLKKAKAEAKAAGKTKATAKHVKKVTKSERNGKATAASEKELSDWPPKKAIAEVRKYWDQAEDIQRDTSRKTVTLTMDMDHFDAVEELLKGRE